MYLYEIAWRLSDLNLFDYSVQSVTNRKYRVLTLVEREWLRALFGIINMEAALLELDDKVWTRLCSWQYRKTKGWYPHLQAC